MAVIMKNVFGDMLAEMNSYYSDLNIELESPEDLKGKILLKGIRNQQVDDVDRGDSSMMDDIDADDDGDENMLDQTFDDASVSDASVHVENHAPRRKAPSVASDTTRDSTVMSTSSGGSTLASSTAGGGKKAPKVHAHEFLSNATYFDKNKKMKDFSAGHLVPSDHISSFKESRAMKLGLKQKKNWMDFNVKHIRSVPFISYSYPVLFVVIVACIPRALESIVPTWILSPCGWPALRW